MTDVDVLTAFAGDPWESSVLTSLDRARGLRVVRRCVDLADLLATVAAGQGSVALVSGELRRLDRDAVARLIESTIAVVGIVPAGPDASDAPAAQEAAEARLRALGVTHVVSADASAEAIVGSVMAASAGRDDAAAAELRRMVEGSRPDPSTRTAGSGNADAAGAAADGDPGSAESRPGRIVAVWGPSGAPGRTTLAVNLAAECAGLGTSTMLADADTYGASVAQTLGLLDEAPGLAAAARAANAGRLDVAQLARHAREVSPGLRVLTGITRSSRWTELSPAALTTVWSVCRAAAAITAVDVGFCLEQDEALTYDTIAPQRNGATLATLAAADTVIVVGSADPIGMGRLVRGLGELVETVPRITVDVVVNRVRRSVAGADPQGQIGAALERFAGLRRVTYLPDDPRAVDAAVAQGLTLAEAAPGSPVRQAIAALARRHLDLDPAGGRRAKVLARLTRRRVSVGAQSG